MKKLFIIANWKSNKTIKETEEWLHDFSDAIKENKTSLENKVIIIAPSFISLEHARYCVENLSLPVRFAVQNISPFDTGAYTGEVNGRQIKEVADYVIVGHSERRQNFFEDDNAVVQKVTMATKYALIPIICISKIEQAKALKGKMSRGEMIIAYEPLFAIGSGNPASPENVDNMGVEIKNELGDVPVLYGGSVTSKNVRSFTSMSHIDGVLVGGASLDPLEFLEIVKNA